MDTIFLLTLLTRTILVLLVLPQIQVVALEVEDTLGVITANHYGSALKSVGGNEGL